MTSARLCCTQTYVFARGTRDFCTDPVDEEPKGDDDNHVADAEHVMARYPTRRCENVTEKSQLRMGQNGRVCEMTSWLSPPRSGHGLRTGRHDTAVRHHRRKVQPSTTSDKG